MHGLHKRFGSTVALERVDLTVRQREVVAILGANGAGKTTLLRILAGAMRPDGGRALVAGHDLLTDSARARGLVGWALGDEHSWYWRLSGRKNLLFFARTRGVASAAASAEVAELMEELELGEYADRLVAEYSTGMKARLALARARLGAPRLIVLDEPSRGLDAHAEQAFLSWLERRPAAGVLLVTHVLAQAATVADRIVVLRKGSVYRELPAGMSAGELEDLLHETE